ncbi:MAG: hypothetical protein ACK514_09640 [Bacteroidota bacterium]|jgi:hypothetical protein|nr:hypothetical protein [Cytophagales bacterium]MCE2958228.1 hypothetical protein [Flammeovirgaceae bacterium]MCZ8072338.1 hypothetical protein [Cytophagales bacterium]
MTVEEFKATLTQSQPPASLSPLLKALWLDAKGSWQASHAIVQDLETKEAAWVHAYLHRKEGDEFNAGYWYQRAGKKFSKSNLEEEWNEITDGILRANY